MAKQPATRPQLITILERWMVVSGLGEYQLKDVVPAEAGMSSETWLLAAIAPDGSNRDWVLRIQPRARQVYQDPSIARQFDVIRCLSQVPGLPVPAGVALEQDADILGAPFFLMERAPGKAPPDGYHTQGLLAEATPAQRESMWEQGVSLLARLHAVDVTPFDFLAWPDGPAGDGIAQELARWDAYLAWSGVPRLGIYDRALRWLDDHRPPAAGTGFAWGDARPCNILYADGKATALLDWETASIGTAETDLGWWLFYDRMMTDAIGLPRLDGLPDARATIALWEAASGRRAQAMEWHIVFAGYRFAMISERAIRMAIRTGHMPETMAGDGNPAICLLTELVRS
ncbi:phosphotransferase family protein [Sphingobium sp. HBC34]|uniref:Phosphotransferase family protein n=1 Tax=Sphingobium cyanobacteriorum TaxID=3063954 RepID=A0ABT8ZPA1_9SPHN|nr:phosphotransferase family protein [Sphingobium sp. HBC34]MDO7836311.1 phosphotransferase family protein [Sphingobium sp. HBC34]